MRRIPQSHDSEAKIIRGLRIRADLTVGWASPPAALPSLDCVYGGRDAHPTVNLPAQTGLVVLFPSPPNSNHAGCDVQS